MIVVRSVRGKTASLLHHHFAVTKQLMTANWLPAFKYLPSLGHRESNDRFRRWTTESESSSD